MPCHARTLWQPNRGQTRDLILRTEILKNHFCQVLHMKTTNSGCCPSKFLSRCISLLVCCSAPKRVARRYTYPQYSAVRSKALVYQGVHVLHNSGLLNCRRCLWLAQSVQRLMLFCFLQLASLTQHCLLRRCVFAVLQAQTAIPSRFHKLHRRCFLFRGPVPFAFVSQLPWDR